MAPHHNTPVPPGPVPETTNTITAKWLWIQGLVIGFICTLSLVVFELARDYYLSQIMKANTPGGDPTSLALLWYLALDCFLTALAFGSANLVLWLSQLSQETRGSSQQPRQRSFATSGRAICVARTLLVPVYTMIFVLYIWLANIQVQVALASTKHAEQYLLIDKSPWWLLGIDCIVVLGRIAVVVILFSLLTLGIAFVAVGLSTLFANPDGCSGTPPLATVTSRPNDSDVEKGTLQDGAFEETWGRGAQDGLLPSHHDDSLRTAERLLGLDRKMEC